MAIFSHAAQRNHVFCRLRYVKCVRHIQTPEIVPRHAAIIVAET